jgi:hypothetical protein
MGRFTTGAMSTSQAKRIELSFLLKSGILKKGHTIDGELYWNLGNEQIGYIKLVCSYTKKDLFIRVIYIATDNNGEKKKYDYNIELEEVESNLGKGKVLYMICPVSGKRCRILYLAYNSEKFKSRETYQNRLYYRCQKSSKPNRWNTRYFELVDKVEKLDKTLKTCSYLNNKTKRVQHIERLIKERDICDIKRWSQEGMTKSMWKAMGTGQYDDFIPRAIS